MQNIRSNDQGMIDLEELARAVDSDVAALMVTNPNTLGVFRRSGNIVKVASRIFWYTPWARWFYMDGANMNALVGVHRAARRFSAST